MRSEFDFIVVGSGAGGGPLACNLALAPEGYRVALLDAGGDPAGVPGSDTFYSYAVPAFHAFASEDKDINWSFFVHHYKDEARRREDPKWVKEKKGVLYPRGSALGGCTAMHALVTLYPNQQDWESMRALTNDDSWSPENMRKYFTRLEQCQDLPRRGPGLTSDPATRHGLCGWLPLASPDPGLLVGDRQLLTILFTAYLFGALAAMHPEVVPALLGKGPPGPADKQKSVEALIKVVGALLEAAEAAPQPLPALSGALLGKLRIAVERLLSGDASDMGRLAAEAPDLLPSLFRAARASLDPNRWFDRDADRVGAFSAPASTLHGVRSAVREHILAVQALYPDRLVLVPNALATRVLIQNGQALGVEYVRGADGAFRFRAASGADPDAELPGAQQLRLRARGEVILSCGAFNTPHLLMLSGVGPADHLKDKGLPVHCDLPGVGQNLHDRYEVAVVSEMPEEFALLKDARFRASAAEGPNDPALWLWQNHRGPYTTNGVALILLTKSAASEGEAPDLCLFGLPGNFSGYYPGYSEDIQSELTKRGRWPNHRRFTWTILKGRPRNRKGTVTLVSADPRDPPEICFHYFDEGSDGWEKDLEALVEGVRLAAGIMGATGLGAKTMVPDMDLTDTEKVKEFIKREAWGHHACGTCKIGNDARSVLDGDFRVRGVRRLRVVDASVFPDIPGFFLVAPVYMIGEKASDVILAERRQDRQGNWPQPVSG